MARARRVVRLERETGGKAALWIARSPVVGKLAALAPRGAELEPGAVVGTIVVLRREVDLVLPDDTRGVMIERLVPGKHPSVAWGEALFTIGESIEDGEDGRSARGAARTASRQSAGTPAGSRDAEVPEGLIAVRSPTDGLFYRRPGPDVAPYVSEGSPVEPGTVLGLVEVMKCFNQIVYGRDGQAAAPGVVEKILAADAGEVKSGQVLMLVKVG